jgi:hypothetical protein
LGRPAGFYYRDVVKRLKRFGFAFHRQAPRAACPAAWRSTTRRSSGA